MSGGEESQRPEHKAGAAHAVKAVLWSFIGIRRRSGYDEDAAKLKPAQVIVAGLIAGIVFVVTLLVVVRLVLATHGSGN